jgi:serine/threonine-protein kinase
VDDLVPGERFAGCRIEAVAGRGGMGVVYRATQLALSRRVALKVVAPEGVADRDFTDRFGREVRMAASIDHPNIVPVYGAGEEAGRLYLVMRYVDGTDLHALVRRAGRLEQARAANIVAQVAAGLDAAHASGLVHRDVKPANVLLTTTSGVDHVYLTDFGLTVEVSSGTRMTTTGHWIGSVDYMAPEQLRAEPVDARTDVYALGGVLHAALTGQAPFHRGTVPQTIAAHLNDPPPRPTALAPVEPAFDAVIARALAKDPADRYRSAGDLGRAAQAAARGERVTIGERTVARGPAAPSEDPTSRLPARPAQRAAPTKAVRPEAVVPARLAPSPPPGTFAGNGRGSVLRPAPAGPVEPRASGAQVAGVARATSADPVRRHRARRRVLLAIGGLLALATAGATAGILANAGSGPRRVSAYLTADEVRGVAQDFADAYGSEDAEALRSTLARHVQRVAPDGAQTGRQDVLGVYRRQFAGADVDAYDLGDLGVVPGAAGRAAGSNTVRRSGRDNINGRVAFGVVREGGKPRIAMIATQPD